MSQVEIREFINQDGKEINTETIDMQKQYRVLQEALARAESEPEDNSSNPYAGKGSKADRINLMKNLCENLNPDKDGSRIVDTSTEAQLVRDLEQFARIIEEKPSSEMDALRADLSFLDELEALEHETFRNSSAGTAAIQERERRIKSKLKLGTVGVINSSTSENTSTDASVSAAVRSAEIEEIRTIQYSSSSSTRDTPPPQQALPLTSAASSIQTMPNAMALSATSNATHAVGWNKGFLFKALVKPTVVTDRATFIIKSESNLLEQNGGTFDATGHSCSDSGDQDSSAIVPDLIKRMDVDRKNRSAAVNTESNNIPAQTFWSSTTHTAARAEEGKTSAEISEVASDSRRCYGTIRPKLPQPILDANKRAGAAKVTPAAGVSRSLLGDVIERFP